MQLAKYSRQRGAVLIVCLVLMLILTVLATSSMGSATLQERIAGNSRDLNTAFQAAEAGVREAEGVLDSAVIGVFNGSGGRYEVCSAADSRTACQPPSWKDRSSSGWVSTATNWAEVSRQPQYILEKYTSILDPEAELDVDQPLEFFEFYRVTARGFGSSDRSMVVLQTYYRRN
jgi:type IV pilus assembly protein PilX